MPQVESIVRRKYTLVKHFNKSINKHLITLQTIDLCRLVILIHSPIQWDFPFLVCWLYIIPSSLLHGDLSTLRERSKMLGNKLVCLSIHGQIRRWIDFISVHYRGSSGNCLAYSLARRLERVEKRIHQKWVGRRICFPTTPKLLWALFGQDSRCRLYM